METEKQWQMFVFGGISSVCGAMATMPLDVIKVRLQLQEKKIYKHSLDALITITRKEGFLALFHGVSPACIRQATYGTCKFGIYGLFRTAMDLDSSEVSFPKRFIAAFGSGAIASALFTPTDLVKTRMQAVNAPSRNYKGFIDAAIKIKKSEGITALYHGFKPTGLRGGVVTGVEFSLYDSIKLKLLQMKIIEDGVLLHFGASFITVFFSSIISNPFDVTKSRILNQSKDNILYKSATDCFIKTIKNEGVLALWKGVVPFYLKNCPLVVISFVVFEQLVKLAKYFET
eukprot:gene6562-10725_t